MVPKCAKIPVKLEFTNNFHHKERFLVLFKECDFFSLICNKDEYNSTIKERVLKNQNFHSYICSHEPFYSGINCVIIEISAEFIKTKNILFVYTPDMSESQFFTRTSEITEEILNKNIERLRKTNMPNFLGRFVMGCERKRELANAHFIMGEYQLALGYYVGIRKEFPDISKRMAEWCKILLNFENELNDKYYDVALLNGRSDIILKILKVLPVETRVAMEYWLSTQDFPRRIAYFIDYICFKNLIKINSLNKGELFFEKCKENVIKMIGTAVNYEKKFWESILIELYEKQEC